MANSELTRQRSSLDSMAKSVIDAVSSMLSSGSGQRASATRKMATGLGWFSVGLGMLELVATRRVARFARLQGRERLLEAYGVREIASGIAILMLRDARAKTLAVWSRVAGDALDLATLGGAALRSRRRYGGHPLAAIAAVAGVTALDLACARTLGRQAHAAGQTTDYSDRSGIPSAPERMRGAALKTFEQPRDMRLAPQRNINGAGKVRTAGEGQ